MPGAWLGMVGGGQLGRMFCFAAQAMGYRVAVLDPDESSPAGSVADRHLRAAYDDESALTELARLCAAVSTEFENVPAASLDFLARSTFVSPAGRCVAIAQDRIAEKRFIAEAGARCLYVRTGRDALGWGSAGSNGLPFILDRQNWEGYLREHFPAQS